MDINSSTPEVTLIVQEPSTHTVHRPYGGIEGLREIRDPAGLLLVTVFPLGMAERYSVVRESLAACYVLASQGEVYIGQSRWIDNASLQQATASAQDIAGEVYLIHAQRENWLFRTALPYLEDRLTELAEEAGLVEVTNCASARTWSSEDHAILGRFVGESLRLLFDAGCRVFHTTPASRPPAAAEADRAIVPAIEETAEIDVDAVPHLGGELALADAGLWARGYYGAEGFVVLAGSEVRAAINPSANGRSISMLPEQLAEIMVPIPGVDNRLRLGAAICFRSPAIAAKFLTGATMGSTNWVRPRYAEQIVVAE
ncbi:hypothetical protein [Bradyrhizobium sp. AS23.2]|uniref:hypothetical protein n=1 Tax=Bradyrhizobium sp. AS23.2 TaxID=1680155 RepID=UPI00116136E2|nr:hypothetical protein [Bradyrhizobium sp. AS23.2]